MKEVFYENPSVLEEVVEDTLNKGILENLEGILVLSPLFILLLTIIFLIIVIFFITLETLIILKKLKDSNHLKQIKKFFKKSKFYYNGDDLKILFEILSRKELVDLANLLKEANTKENRNIILGEVFEINRDDIEAYKNEMKNKTKKIFRKK